MYIDFMIRRRPSLEEGIPQLNEQLTQRLSRIAGFWGAGKAASDASLGFKGESGSLDLRHVLRAGLSGQASYCARFAGYVSRDVGASDDYLAFRIDTVKMNCASFCSETLPEIIEVFRPYRVEVETNNDLAMADWEITRELSRETGRDLAGRDLMYRIWPVCYIDDLLCQRSFGIGAEEVVRRAAPECERATLLCGGAFLIVTSEIVTDPTALDALHERVTARFQPFD